MVSNKPDMEEPVRDEEPKQKEEPAVKKKISESLENLKKNERIEDLYKYAQSNTADTIAYVAMIVGILTIFFNPFYGGVIVGVVAGLYFADEIMHPIRNIEDFLEEQGMVRSIILGGVVLAFFIVGFWIYIGAAIGVAVRLIVFPGKTSKKNSQSKED